jgi:hypothetical protein
MGKKGGVAGGINQTLFGDGGAGAAQNAAMAQQSAANKNYDTVSGIVNNATIEGLANTDKAIALQTQNIDRQSKLIAQLDPTIVEASQQALKLLQGQDSSTLAPVKNQRSTQRQQLVNQLRAQLGPGAETSTAGIQALNKFDSETSNVLNSAQQSWLGQVGNTATQFNGVKPQMLNEIMGLDNLYQNKSGMQFQQASLLNSAANPVISNAGAQYTAEALKGKQNQAFGQSLFNAAVQGGAMAMTGGASGAAKKPGASANAGGGSGYDGISADTLSGYGNYA